MITKIINGKIITDKVETNKALYMEGETILAITGDEIACDRIIDAEGNYVSPGFIDIHTHGGGGHDFMDGGIMPIIEGAKMHLKHGTTTIMPTTLASAPDVLERSLADIKSAMDYTGVAPHIIGAHLEGPYFSLNQAGAQDPKYITPPVKSDYERLINDWAGVIKRWSFAPELKDADVFCKTLTDHNIIPSIAHSDAVYEDVMGVYHQGCKLITHFYSGMSGLTRKDGFRILGVVETGYLLDDMKIEVIADGKHLPPELLKLIYKVKGAENICLVTDSMRGAGMGKGPSILGPKSSGVPCVIEDGIARMPDRKNFAGSVATADRLIQTMHVQAGVEIAEAVKMMTEVPADIVGLSQKGYLKHGNDADIVIFDENIEVKKVILAGTLI